jgi:hypothetical protein
VLCGERAIALLEQRVVRQERDRHGERDRTQQRRGLGAIRELDQRAQ